VDWKEEQCDSSLILQEIALQCLIRTKQCIRLSVTER